MAVACLPWHWNIFGMSCSNLPDDLNLDNVIDDGVMMGYGGKFVALVYDDGIEPGSLVTVKDHLGDQWYAVDITRRVGVHKVRDRCRRRKIDLLDHKKYRKLNRVLEK